MYLDKTTIELALYQLVDENNWMINFFSGQDAIRFNVETNSLTVFDLCFHTISYVFEQDKLYY